ncbi:MAG: hypothetical protein WCJ25_03945 [Candidatus Moraniibacteriota bacterium]
MEQILVGVIAVLMLVVFAWPRTRAFFSLTSRVILSTAFAVSVISMAIVVPEVARQGNGLPNGHSGDMVVGSDNGSTVSGRASGLSTKLSGKTVGTEGVAGGDASLLNSLSAVKALLSQDDGQITTSQIAFHGIESRNIDSNSITSRTIRDGAVHSDALADSLTIRQLTVGNLHTEKTITADSGLALGQASAPSSPTGHLYNLDGTLYWSGMPIGGSAIASWDTDGADVYRLSGNVGIGTTIPGVALDVVGAVRSSVGFFGKVIGTVSSLENHSTDALIEGVANRYFTDARARDAIVFSGAGLSYDSGTGIASVTSGYGIPTVSQIANWNTAYTQTLRWDGGSTGLNAASGRTSLGLGSAAQNNVGDFVAYRTFGTAADSNAVDFATAAQGVLAANALPSVSYSAADVIAKLLTVDGAGSALDADTLDSHDSTYFYPASNPSAYISDGNTNWDNSYGFISSYTETDPVFTASTAHGITGTNVSNWSTAYGWGNHANAGYLTTLSGAVLTDQTIPQTVGTTGARLAKLWTTNLDVSNAITGSVTGNAGTATKLAAAKNINGVAFDGSADIGVPSNIAAGTSGNLMISNGTVWTSTGVPTWNQSTTGTAAGLSSTLAVANGGTGSTNGSITGTGALTFTAGGSNQNVTLTPSGSGYTVLNGNVGIGTTSPTQALSIVGAIDIAGNIVPSANNTYALGSPTRMWKDFYVGPGSIYVNGQKVLQTDLSDSVVVSADTAQNLIFKTTGGGNVEINPAVGGGELLIKSNISLTGGKSFDTTDHTPVSFTYGIASNSFSSMGALAFTAGGSNQNVTLTPSGSGYTILNGNVGIGTTTPGVTLDVVGAVRSSAGFQGNLSGTAGSVTNGLYSTGSYADPSWLSSLSGAKISGNILGVSSNVTGTVAIGNGGTGATTKQAAFDALSPLAAKGSIVSYDGTHDVSHVLGTDGAALLADSTQSDGLRWGTPSVPWSSLTDPTANLALSMANKTTTFTYGNATGLLTDLFTVTDTAGNTGLGTLVSIQTKTGSLLKPFKVNATGAFPAIMVDSSGLVGLGTDTPASQLTVSGGATIGGVYATTLLGDGDAAISDKLGIGTTAPLRRLQIHEATANTTVGARISANYSTGAVYAGIEFAGSAAGAPVGNISYDFQNSALVLASGAFGTTPGFAMLGNGNVGIGTTSPGTKLEVNGTISQTCPTGYVWVPGLAKFGTLPGFCVMKYDAKCDDNANGKGDTTAADATYATWHNDTSPCVAGSGRAVVSSPEGSPLAYISQETARTYCQGLGTGYHLVSEAEWMTMAEQISDTAINDTDSDASLQLATGHSDNVPATGLVATTGSDPIVSGCDLTKDMENVANAYVAGSCEIRGAGAYAGNDTDKGFYGTGQNWSATGYSAGAANKSQLRTFVLPNGKILWDLAGNVYQWTDSLIIAQEEPEDATPADEWLQYTAVTKWKALNYARPHNQSLATANGIGQLYTNVGTGGTASRAFFRGGYWSSGSGTGVFTLS